LLYQFWNKCVSELFNLVKNSKNAKHKEISKYLLSIRKENAIKILTVYLNGIKSKHVKNLSIWRNKIKAFELEEIKKNEVKKDTPNFLQIEKEANNMTTEEQILKTQKASILIKQAIRPKKPVFIILPKKEYMNQLIMKLISENDHEN